MFNVLRVAGCLGLLALWVGPGTIRAQQPVPDPCGAAGDLSALIECARKRDTTRATRCANPEVAAMSWPSAGDVILPFGTQTRMGTVSKGLVIATPSGAAVTSPASGMVLFAGSFRSYGQIVVIDACSHDLLLAGLAGLDRRAGGTITKGQPVGSMSKTTSEPPVLYIEARRDGRPVDPAPLLGPR